MNNENLCKMLCYVCQNKPINLEHVKIILNNGINLNNIDSKYIEFISRTNAEFLELLIDYGFDLSEKNIEILFASAFRFRNNDFFEYLLTKHKIPKDTLELLLSIFDWNFIKLLLKHSVDLPELQKNDCNFCY